MRMKRRTVEILLSLLPVIILIVMLALVIRAFGSDALNGGSQVSLLISAGVCSAISLLYFRIPWKTLEESIMRSVGSVTTAIIILLMIGAISGVWILSGVVPTLIHYGLMLIHPKFFLVTTCIICAIVSVLTDSSWSTIATIGIALLGIGQAQGFSSGLIAGAIISGAYFGDKMSPLSDTTVLASTMSDVPLFSHIRYMMYTVVPTMVITLVIFTIIGFSYSVSDATLINLYQQLLQEHFNLSPWLMIVPLLTILMIVKKWPAVIVLFLSSLLGAIFALIFQPHILAEVAGTRHDGYAQHHLPDTVCHVLWRSDDQQWYAATHHPPDTALHPQPYFPGSQHRQHGLLHGLHGGRPIPEHHPYRQYVQGCVSSSWLRRAPDEPQHRRQCHGYFPPYPLEQLRHDTGHHPGGAYPHLPALLLLQHHQSADEHHSSRHWLQDI